MNLTKKLLEKLGRKSYREAYVEENVRTGIAYQIRALREARGWSQKKLAEAMGKPQSVLSRIEDPDYGKLSIQTLLEVASAFDIALIVQFADFPEFVKRMEDVSPEALNRESFSETKFTALSGRTPFSEKITPWWGPHGADFSSSISSIYSIGMRYPLYGIYRGKRRASYSLGTNAGAERTGPHGSYGRRAASSRAPSGRRGRRRPAYRPHDGFRSVTACA